jgi:hypothetical protein
VRLALQDNRHLQREGRPREGTRERGRVQRANELCASPPTELRTYPPLVESDSKYCRDEVQFADRASVLGISQLKFARSECRHHSRAGYGNQTVSCILM